MIGRLGIGIRLPFKARPTTNLGVVLIGEIAVAVLLANLSARLVPLFNKPPYGFRRIFAARQRADPD